MKRFYLLSIILFLTSLVVSGTNWEYHLSKLHTYQVVKGKDKIFFLSDGGIFYFDQKDNSIGSYTKIEGLSGSDVRGMEYSNATSSLVVFYQDAMVDIVPDEGNPIPIPDIKRKNIAGNKSIYNATCSGELCYLSCGFGIVVIDLANREIKDSFIIGQNGNYDAVFDVALSDTSIYAATSDGIRYAAIDSPNLLDFNNWNYVDNSYLREGDYLDLENILGTVWSVFNDNEWKVDMVVSQHGPQIWYRTETDLKSCYSLSDNVGLRSRVLTGRIEKLGYPSVVRIDRGGGDKEDILKYSFSDYDSTPYNTDTIGIDPRGAVIDNDGTVWIADWNYGAVRYKNGQFDLINPDGPIDNGAFAMHFVDNKLWIAKGGRSKAWGVLNQDAMVQSYLPSDLQWDSYNQFTHPVLKDYKDVVGLISVPGEPNHIFASTWGGGILEFNNGNFVKAHDDQNSTLKNAGGIDDGYYVRVGGMAYDSEDNLWVSNSEVECGLHKMSPGGKWESFDTPEIANEYGLGKVIVTEDDNIWMMVPRDKTSGLYVMSNDGKNSETFRVVSYFSNGEKELLTDMNDVYDIVEDKDGEIWVGTSFGVAVYSHPERVFDENPFYAEQPGVDENDGLFHPLLASETVTAIAIDGGNRKYCGTKSSGLYLISPDGTNEIEHYTAENSALISNSILSLAYDGPNGFLYVGTELGLVSLRTSSKEAFSNFDNVYAYPNPVRSNYDGDIFITGMMEDTNVKITNISGRLVYETTSVGGQASWDGCDLAGNKVHTGVYLVFCANSDGTESAVTKILFIRPPQ